MSVDLSLGVDRVEDCPECDRPRVVHYVDDYEVGEFNFTYNYGAMWKKALEGIPKPHAWETRYKTVHLDGLFAEESAEFLQAIIEVIEADLPGFAELNPTNGWGNSELFLQRLQRCLHAAKNAPREAYWTASR